MYIMNGVCYAGKSGSDSKITAVKALDGMMLLLTFEGGEKRLFDAHELTGPAFDPLKDPAIFKTAAIQYGAVVWLDGEIDCAPEFMYKHSYHYDEMAV